MASPSIFISIAGSPPRLVDGELCIEGELLNLHAERDLRAAGVRGQHHEGEG